MSGRESYSMSSFPFSVAKTFALALAFAAIAGFTSGCANPAQRSGGTAALGGSSNVQGRDLGRGGATSGGVSSLDPSGNAADYSIYDARQIYH